MRGEEGQAQVRVFVEVSRRQGRFEGSGVRYGRQELQERLQAEEEGVQAEVRHARRRLQRRLPKYVGIPSSRFITVRGIKSGCECELFGGWTSADERRVSLLG